LQAPPLATSNQTLIAIIAQQDIVNIERVIAVFSPADAVIFFNRSALLKTQLRAILPVCAGTGSEDQALTHHAVRSLKASQLLVMRTAQTSRYFWSHGMSGARL
jgi:hypothetical protein